MTEKTSLDQKSNFAGAQAFPGSGCRTQFRKWKANIPGSKLLLEEKRGCLYPGRERKCGQENKRIFDGNLTAKHKAKHPWMWTSPKKGPQFSKATQTGTSIQVQECQIQGSNLILVNPSSDQGWLKTNIQLPWLCTRPVPRQQSCCSSPVDLHANAA